MMLVFLGRRVVGPPVEFAKPTSAACACRSLLHLEARRDVCTVGVIMRYTLTRENRLVYMSSFTRL